CCRVAVSDRIPAVTGNRSGMWRGAKAPRQALEALRTGFGGSSAPGRPDRSARLPLDEAAILPIPTALCRAGKPLLDQGVSGRGPDLPKIVEVLDLKGPSS